MGIGTQGLSAVCKLTLLGTTRCALGCYPHAGHVLTKNHVCLVVATERDSSWLQDQWQAEADAAQAELDSIGKDEL